MTKKSKNYENLREIAQMLFLQGYLQKEIAVKLGISEQTITRWGKEDNWKHKKTNILMSKNNRLSELYEELAEFNKMIREKEGYKVASSKEGDARRKLIKDISELERKYNIAQTTVIARDFILFTSDMDFDFAQKANGYFDLFINDLINKQKWQEQ